MFRATLVLCGIIGCAIGFALTERLSGQPSVSPPGSLTVIVDGSVVSGVSTLNLTSGNGIVWTCVPGPCSGTAGVLNIAAAVSTVTILSKPTFQSGVCDAVFSTNGTRAYTYSFGPTCEALTAYTPGMHLRLIPDTTNFPDSPGFTTGSATLNIDNIGLKNIKQSDGATDPVANSLIPGREYPIWFDGVVFRLE